MNILVDPLPNTVKVGGGSVPINTDFRAGIQFEVIMQDVTKSTQQKIMDALSIYYSTIPNDISGAVEGMLWLYRCGADVETKASGQGGRAPRKAYCFQQDANTIYATFWACYGIDLSTVELHWWEFRSLFLGLPAECEMKKIMGYRVADLRGMSKNQKKHYEKMRKLYALRNNRSVESTMSLKERDEQMKAYVVKRMDGA